jgi:hypothetical protein
VGRPAPSAAYIHKYWKPIRAVVVVVEKQKRIKKNRKEIVYFLKELLDNKQPHRSASFMDHRLS